MFGMIPQMLQQSAPALAAQEGGGLLDAFYKDGKLTGLGRATVNKLGKSGGGKHTNMALQYAKSPDMSRFANLGNTQGLLSGLLNMSGQKQPPRQIQPVPQDPYIQSLLMGYQR